MSAITGAQLGRLRAERRARDRTVSQTANGLHVETRAFPARPSGHASTARRVVAVACKGQRPSPLALDAMFAYAESSDPARSPWTRSDVLMPDGSTSAPSQRRVRREHALRRPRRA